MTTVEQIRKEIIRKAFHSSNGAARAKLGQILSADETVVLADALDLELGELHRLLAGDTP